MGPHRRQQHFLIVTYPIQSHINPALRLARRLSTGGAASLVTFSTAASAHSRMFPSATSAPVSDPENGNLSFFPYPDGYQNRGLQAPDASAAGYSDDEFAAVLRDLAARGRRVTCVVYTLLLTWAADVARDHGIPSALYWIQPATVLAAYYHYFHGHEPIISAHRNDPGFSVKLPGLPPLQIRDLPSFLTCASSDGLYAVILLRLKEDFEQLDKAKPASETEPRPKILVNSFAELEPEALAAVPELDLIAVGPILAPDSGFELFKQDEKNYMDWLDKKEEKSVVYVSFGSISVVIKLQMEEILKGLKASGRPYLWVVRNDSRWEGLELEGDGGESNDGMVVEWCSQVRVLSHPAIGCFVTHCGWNSTTESLVSGVPTVAVPQWTDQGTNAMLMEKAWGMGARGEVNGDGVLEGEELRRCLDLVMGEGETGREIRRNAKFWKEKAREAVSEGGSSDRNLRAFVEEIAKYDSELYP